MTLLDLEWVEISSQTPSIYSLSMSATANLRATSLSFLLVTPTHKSPTFLGAMQPFLIFLSLCKVLNLHIKSVVENDKSDHFTLYFQTLRLLYLFTHLLRISNRLAHSLVHMTCSYNGFEFWIEEVPPRRYYLNSIVNVIQIFNGIYFPSF